MRSPKGPMWKNRIVGHGRERPDQLLANPLNWRIHPEVQQDELEKVLEIVGWVQDVIVNQRTGHMVDGHLRVQLALRRDEEEVPVTYIDISEEEERLVLLVLDPLAALAGTDKEKQSSLAEEVAPAFPESELDFAAILRREKTHTKGLTHEVKACSCCEKRCEPGCGCYREEAQPQEARYPRRHNEPRLVKEKQ